MTTLGLLRRNLQHWRQRFLRSNIIWLGAVLLIVVNSTIGVIEKSLEVRDWAIHVVGWDKCHLYDPATGLEAKNGPTRPCLPGQITFIKYRYPYPYPTQPVPPGETGNRAIQVVAVRNGQATWTEQAYLGQTRTGQNWEKVGNSRWAELGNGWDLSTQSVLNLGNDPELGRSIPTSGFIIRRLETGQGPCTGLSPQLAGTTSASMFEFFVENRVESSPSRFERMLFQLNGKVIGDLRGQSVYIYSRWTPIACSDEITKFSSTGLPFGRTGYQIIQEVADPD